MAYEVPCHKPPVGLAGADLSTYQFRFVKVDATGVVLATAGTDACIGVLQNKPTLGQACEVETIGTTKLVAGALVAKGAAVMSDGSGRAITAVATNMIQGIALEGAGAAGEYLTVLLRPMGTL